MTRAGLWHRIATWRMIAGSPNALREIGMMEGTQLGPNASLVGVPGSRNSLSTPALVLDLDALEANIAYMAQFLGARDHGLRPVAKIHKSTEIAKRQIEAGAKGLCCATLAEAEVLGQAGIPGLLLFSSVVTEPKIERLMALNAVAEGLMVAVDEPHNVEKLAASAAHAGQALAMLVDVEVGGGRTGITDPEAVIALAQKIDRLPGARFAGLQGYHGGLQRTEDYEERADLQAACVAPLTELKSRLAEAGLDAEVVTGGGTGTYEIDTGQGVLTENQAGTYIFMDVNYRETVFERKNPHPFRPALFVRTSVISTCHDGYVVTDAGLKEFSREMLLPHIMSGAPEGATYNLIGDDLGRINLPVGAPAPKLGDAVECLTPHCYATLNLYPVYHCVRGDTLVDIWPIDARANW